MAVPTALLFFFHEVWVVGACYAFGKPCETVISAVGGETHLQQKEALPLWKRCIVRLTGLLGTFIIWTVSGWFVYSWVEGGVGNVETTFAYTFFSVCSFLLVVNLLPFYPLDMGAILIDIAGTVGGRLGERICGALLSVSSFVLALHFSLISLKALACVAFVASLRSAALLWREEKIEYVKKDKEKLQGIEETWNSGEQEEAIRQLEALLLNGNDKKTRKVACLMCGKYLIALERYRDAYRLFASSKDPLLPESLELFVLSAYQTSHFSKGLLLVKKLFLDEPSAALAIMAALLSARMQKNEEAKLWLKSAFLLGFSAIDKVYALPDFERGNGQ
jgi:hypothetical protein